VIRRNVTGPAGSLAAKLIGRPADVRHAALIHRHGGRPWLGQASILSKHAVAKGLLKGPPVRLALSIGIAFLRHFGSSGSKGKHEEKQETGPMAQPKHPLIASDRVEGTAVFSRDERQIGTIKSVMIEKVNGRVKYAVMTFVEPYGREDEIYVIPWSKLTYDMNVHGYHTDLTEFHLKDAPRFSVNEEIDWAHRHWEDELEAYFNIPASMRAI
jgi:hypothetical protein